jgi:outer membrane protein
MKILASVAVVCLLCSGTLAAQTAALVGSGIAYFSLQRVFSQSAAGKDAIAKLTAIQAQESKPLEEKQKTLIAERQAFEIAAPQLSDSARTERIRQLERAELDTRRLFEDLQKHMMGVQRDAESAFLAKLKPILNEVVKEKSLLVLFNEDAGTIAWADITLDLTDEIVKRLDSSTTKKP